MARLCEDDLRAFLDRRNHNDPVEAVIDLAESTLVEFLGVPWVRRHVRVGTPSNYFRTYDVRPGDEFRHHHRYISLAEMLFNLQGQPGFTERLTIISRHDVEAGVAELELAKFLTACGTRFEFRNRTGSSGLDYDLRIFLPDGNELAAESKCKLEGTPYSKGTIANSLSKARKQLPQNEPGLVLIKLPEDWFLGDDTLEALETALRSFFRNTNRVVGVLLLWERWKFLEDRARASTKYDFRVNPTMTYPMFDPETIFSPDLRASGWVDYLKLCGL